MIVLSAVVAVVPMMIRGNSCGHDFDFHLVSWFDVLDSWRHGILYPHWAPSPNFGAGEPRFVFYPPLTWMLGAALGAVLEWVWVAPAMCFLFLAAAGLATRALARQSMAEGPATLAGCIAVFSGYTLFTVYERSAFGELTGGFWIPLLLLLVLREETPVETAWWRRAIGGPSVLLALVMAGAWLSNAPLGVMASYLLAAFAAAVSAMRRSWTPVLRAVAGAVFGLGLSAAYLVPAAIEQKWVDIRQATDDPGLAIGNSFLFGRHADPQLALHDVELTRVSWIAVAMIGAALASVLRSWRRRTLPGSRTWWAPLALIPVAVMFLLLPVSLPVWNGLPKLEFLQFPWRWLVVLEAPLGIFVASAVWTTARRLRTVTLVACGIGCAGLAVVAGRTLFQVCDDQDTVVPMVKAWHAGEGFVGTDEYEPPGADDTIVPENLPGGCMVSEPTETLGVIMPDDPQPQWAANQRSCLAALEFDPVRSNPEHWIMRGNAPQAGYVVLRLRTYRTWDVRVNGKLVWAVPAVRDDGLMDLWVPAGPLTITADWRVTSDVEEGRLISIVSLLLVTVLGALALRRKRSQLK